MKTLLVFLKEQMGGILLYVCFAGVFAFVFDLYGVRTDAVSYAFLLGFILLVLYGGFKFCRLYRRHQILIELEGQLKAQWESLPKAQTFIEADYQRMLEYSCSQKAEIASQAAISHQEMLDYYSLWAHQIKTPIAAMRVLLQSEEHSKELKMELFKVEQYVEMVLSYLRMEDMHSDLAFGVVSIDDLVRQAVRKYSQMFILQKIKLNFTPSEAQILTDEKWLVFVIEQLLSNALKYTKTGEISIYMIEHMRLVIEDTGIGIWEEDLPRVFERGFTGYNGRTDKKSTGIGLYLCKQIMDKLGHEVWMESKVGEGTKVYLELLRNSSDFE